MSFMVRVISLARAGERRRLFRETAASSHVPWSFFDAHEKLAPFLHDDVDQQLSQFGRRLEHAELGCYSSHVALWREFLDSDSQTLLAVEDDVIVDWEFIRGLTDFDLTLSNLHYLRLFAKFPSYFRRVQTPFLGYYHLIQNLGIPCGTQAYVLTRHGATILMRHCTTVVHPIDVEMDRAWAHGVRNLQVFPSPVLERCVPSTIGERRLTLPPIARTSRARMGEALLKWRYWAGEFSRPRVSSELVLAERRQPLSTSASRNALAITSPTGRQP
jgi:glycosyl transferase family 25